MSFSRTRLARAVATVGGVGRAPWAPGTFGTIAALPIALAAAPLSLPAYALLCVVITAAAIWAADVTDRSWGTRDDQRIVIDEVAGYLVAAAAVDRGSGVALLWALVVFRIFDIAKPPPIRWLEKRLGGGAGVVLDDIAAGVYAAALLLLLQRLGLFGAS